MTRPKMLIALTAAVQLVKDFTNFFVQAAGVFAYQI